ncbi:MAG TPA: cyanophycinase [Methylibium sp.]|nr:cyanophycinase [Methylibium sp.]
MNRPTALGVTRRHLLRLAVAGAALPFGLSIAAEPEQRPEAATGYAVAIGGALKYDHAAIWTRLVQLSGGTGSRWVVIPAAAANPQATGWRLIDALERHGAQADLLPVAPRWAGTDVARAVRDPLLIERVRSARGVFFAGGAQEYIVDALQPDGKRTPLLEAIWDVFRSGGVIAGTSAGAAVMSTTMFRDAMDVRRVLINGRLIQGQEIDRGLGFIGSELFVDQHFLKRGRIGRILPVMVQAGYKLGLGVEEDTAAIVHGSTVEILGAKGALLVDLSDATRDDALGAFNLRNARLSYLDRGDRHDLATGVTTPSPQKLAGMAIDPSAPDFRPYNRRAAFHGDILGDSAIVNAMSHLIDNRDTEALGLALPPPGLGEGIAALGFEFRLRRAPDSRGWYTGAFGGEDYTVLGIRLDVTPVRMAQPMYVPLQSTSAAVPSAPAR